MSTLMMPAPAMTTMSTPAPLPVPAKLEATTKLTATNNINQNSTPSNNKAGMFHFFDLIKAFDVTFNIKSTRVN